MNIHFLQLPQQNTANGLPNRTDTCSLGALEARSLNPRGGGGGWLLRRCRGSLVPALLCVWWLPSASGAPQPLPAPSSGIPSCMSLCHIPPVRTPVIGLGTHPS